MSARTVSLTGVPWLRIVDALEAEGIRDDLVFQMGQEIHQINEYKAALYANKRKGTYDLKADLTKVYRPDGTDYAVKIDTVQFKNVRDMYTALHHFAALTPQKD